MNSNTAHRRRECVYQAFCVSLVTLVALATFGCGGAPSQVQSTSSLVTILAASTANDQLFQYSMTINSLTLTSQSGSTVNLLTSPLYVEFMHLNGAPEPLITTSVPAGTYTAATATIGTADFTCATTGSNGVLATDNFLRAPVPASDVVVKLPAPISISGKSMILNFDLLVSQSANFTNCDSSGAEAFSATPNFSVSAVALSSNPTNAGNGKLVGLEGIIASIDGATNSLVVTSADGSNGGGTDPANGPSWRVGFDANTTLQGIGNSAQLAAGIPVDLDIAIQPDGSMLATRIAVYDKNASNTSLWVVPALFEDDSLGSVMLTGEKEQLGPVQGGDGAPINFSGSQFQISQQMRNLASLPFQPTFTGANMVAGQNIEPTFHLSTNGSGTIGPTPATITLLPQTINGTVSAIGSEGGFTTYTVTLASYDLFPTLAVQSGQTTQLTDPSTVVIYADSNTQMLNTSPIAMGAVERFYGLVFNDGGTLRMDCAQINDGVGGWPRSQEGSLLS